MSPRPSWPRPRRDPRPQFSRPRRDRDVCQCFRDETETETLSSRDETETRPSYDRDYAETLRCSKTYGICFVPSVKLCTIYALWTLKYELLLSVSDWIKQHCNTTRFILYFIKLQPYWDDIGNGNRTMPIVTILVLVCNETMVVLWLKTLKKN